MTFYEAAVKVLRQAARPLTSQEITQLSVEQQLLSHVGKSPEAIMLARLSAMARRTRDRQIIVTATQTFALADWNLPEDQTALFALALDEKPQDDTPPLRGAERHPVPNAEYVRSLFRPADRRRHDDHRKRYPPVAEVAFEILSNVGTPLGVDNILAMGREKAQFSEEFQEAQLWNALVEDNQRRIDSGRRPQFAPGEPHGDGRPAVVLNTSDDDARGLQERLCALAGIPFENGRAQVKTSTPAGRSEPVRETEAPINLGDWKRLARDTRRAGARALRQRLTALAPRALDKAISHLLHAMGFRELRFLRRSPEKSLLVARKRDGSLELRWVIRVVGGAQPWRHQ